MSEAKRDGNNIPTLIGTSLADGTTPVNVYVDPVTHRLLVSLATGANYSGALSGITNITIVNGLITAVS